MTTELDTSKGYARLDWYVDLIVQKLDDVVSSVKTYMESYFKAASEENISEEDAKKYLKSKLPHSTYYKYLPLDISKRIYTKNESPPVDNYRPEESSSGQFNTEGMGVVVAGDDPGGDKVASNDPDIKSQTVDCPANDVPPDVNEVMVRELREELAEKDKAIDELRREMNAVIAANPDLQKNPDLYKNMQNELKRVIAENEELKSQISKPEFVRAIDIQDKPEPRRRIVPHKRLLEIRSAIIQTGGDGDLEFVWDDDGNFVGVNVV